MKKLLLFALTAVLAMPTAANADTLSFDFDLENWGATSGNIVDQVIDFGTPVTVINSVSVELSHSFASDIELGLYAPGDNQATATDLGDVPLNASYNLTSDLGSLNDLGDGGSVLTGVSTYVFYDPSNGFGDLGSTGQNPIPGGDYDAISWGAGGAGAGWRFILTDDAGGDLGAIGNVTITYNVPEPTSAMLLLAGLGIAVARRRR